MADRAGWLACAAVACALALPAQAADGPCSCWHTVDRTVLPSPPGTGGLPRNLRVWLGDAHYLREDGTPADVVLMDAADRALPMRQSILRETDALTLAVYTPEALLETGSDYSVRVDGTPITWFTVGTDVDEEPPQVRVVASDAETTTFGFACGGASGASWQVESDAVAHAVLHRGAPGLDPAGPAGETLVFHAVNDGRYPYDRLWVGSASCGGNDPSVGPGSQVEVDIHGFDLAGNHVLVQPPPETVPHCGCGGAPATALALAGLAALRRRRPVPGAYFPRAGSTCSA